MLLQPPVHGERHPDLADQLGQTPQVKQAGLCGENVPVRSGTPYLGRGCHEVAVMVEAVVDRKLDRLSKGWLVVHRCQKTPTCVHRRLACALSLVPHQ